MLLKQSTLEQEKSTEPLQRKQPKESVCVHYEYHCSFNPPVMLVTHLENYTLTSEKKTSWFTGTEYTAWSKQGWNSLRSHLPWSDRQHRQASFRDGSLNKLLSQLVQVLKSHIPNMLPYPPTSENSFSPSKENCEMVYFYQKTFYLHHGDLLLVDSNSIKYKTLLSSFSFDSFLG